ncbi:MAG: TetR/AcrR family transcriptional regulator [Acidimicrobiales bacterium]
MARTQGERKAETRSRLLAAAAELFAAQGIDAVSVDAVAEAAGRTSGAVYAHFGSKQGLLLALLDAWKDSVLTVLLAEVAVTDSPAGQLGAVWANLSDPSDRDSSGWPLLEHELWLRAARDPEVADVIRVRNAEALRYSARRIAGWTAAVGAQPAAGPEELAVLVKALLTGLAMQKRLDPGSVPDDLALRGLAALVGVPAGTPGRAAASTTDHRDNERPPTTQETTHAH